MIILESLEKRPFSDMKTLDFDRNRKHPAESNDT